MLLFRNSPKYRKMRGMRQEAVLPYRQPLIALAILAVLGAGGLAFYGWLRFGASIMLSLGESGLSWCF